MFDWTSIDGDERGDGHEGKKRMVGDCVVLLNKYL